MDQIQTSVNPSQINLEAPDYTQQNQKLHSLGYENSKKNLRLLSKLNGDLEKAIEKLKIHSEKRLQREEMRKNRVKLTKEQKKEAIQNEIKEKGFEDLIKKFNELGFDKDNRNLRVLKKFEGNYEQALAKLQKFSNEHKERQEQRKEKRALREKEPKPEKLEKKQKRERRPRDESSDDKLKVQTAEYEIVPDNITTIYLDGNNMLFCEDAIRKLVLHRQRLEAEKVLSNIAHSYGQLQGRFNIILVYDRTKFNLLQKFANQAGKDLDYTVLSAAPQYQSSDDALVDWAQEEKENAKNCLFVTSDRELQRRLSSAGVTDIMKPGRWLKLVKATIGEENYKSLLPNKQDENLVNQH